MPTAFPLDDCRLPGTTFRDQGTGKAVSVKPRANETIEFFHLDCPAFREEYHRQRKPVCDLLVDYHRKAASYIDLFVELKSTNYPRAVEQIEGAIDAIAEELRGCHKEVELRALVVGSGSAPPTQGQLVKRLSKRRVRLEFKTGIRGRKAYDLGPHLRK